MTLIKEGRMIEDTRVVKLKSKVVKRLPIGIRLPNHFIKSNNIQMNDVLEMYIARSGELIIKKKES